MFELEELETLLAALYAAEDRADAAEVQLEEAIDNAYERGFSAGYAAAETVLSPNRGCCHYD